MRQMGLILSIMGILGMIVFLPAETNPDSETERVKRARKMASEARSLYHGKKIDAAADKYVEISEIYADLKQKYPEKKAYQKDYRHYLNQSGYVRLKYGQAMAREKKYKQAAEFYRKAVEAYQNALKKLPNTRIFKQNIEYCEYYGSQAAFTHALTNRDFAPEFSVLSLAGKKIMLSQFKGKVLILKFMTGWCPTCHKNMALMKRLYQTYNEKGLEILCISLDRVKSWKKRNGEKETRHLAESQPFPFAWGDKAVYYQYGIFRSVPTLFLLDRELKIVKQIGSDDRSFEKISADIETLLK